MDEPGKGLSLNGAPSQYERWLRTTGPASAKVDGRTFYELLSFAVPFGGLLTFYDLANQPDGDWTPFFLTDPTMILASVATMDLPNVELQFSALLSSVRDTGPVERKNERLRESFLFILGIVRQIDSWLGAAHMHPGSRPARLFAGEVSSWIGTSLGAQLRQLKAESELAALSGPLAPQPGLNFNGLIPLWNLSQTCVLDRPDCGDTSPAKQIDSIAARLDSIFGTFVEVLVQLQKFAGKHLPDTLLESNHKPQIALYIAFTRLFRTAQRTMNTLTKRFAQFYYRDILRETNAGLIPDSVYLTFSLDPKAGVDVATVPAGTQFPAGKDANGTAILYASAQDLSVSAAVLAIVRALRVVSGPLYTTVSASPGLPDAEAQAPQLLLGTVIDVPLMNDEAAGKVPDGGLIPWTTFGESTSGNGAIAVTATATLGFALASQYLMLTGGERTATLTFQLTPDSPQVLEAALDALAAATGLDPESVFAQLLDSAFDVYLSTADGWFLLDTYSCAAILASSPPVPPAFSLSFALPASAPPVAGFDPPPDQPAASAPVPDNLNPAPGLPSLKAYLRQAPVTIWGPGGTVSTYPLSLLAQLRIDWIEIRTATADLANLQVETTTGPVDTSSPYPVFGGTPVAGSFIQLSNTELFVKRPDPGSLQVNLKWFGLPPNEDGFAGYYRDYVLGLNGQPSPTVLFDNQTFRGDMRIVNPGTWDLRDSPPPWTDSPPTPGLFLFRSQDSCSSPMPEPAGSLCEVSTFDNLDPIDTDPPPYYDPSSSAIRLTLTEPAYAFGNVLYASNVLNAVIADLPQVDKGGLSAPGCQPLSAAADSLAAAGNGDPASANNRDRIQAIVRQSQGALIQAAKSYLSQSLSRIDPETAAWVQGIFSTPESKAPAYRAQVVRGRLRGAVGSTGKLGFPASPPGLPESAADSIEKSAVMLQAVVWMQQCLDTCAAEPAGTYRNCIETQLIACQQRLRQACSDCSQASLQMNYPNVPWLPQAQAMSVSYSASCGFQPAASGQHCGSYFHLLPFGGYAGVNDSTGGSPGTPLLSVPDPGNLDLGFSGLTAAQAMSLLFQMSTGSGADSQAVAWQYLESNAWVAFTTGQVPYDTTNGLLNTGILTFNVPASGEGDQTETVAPSGYRWLRAVTQEPQQFPDTIGIYPHPSIATWDSGDGSSGGHLSQPLPPYIINSSVPNLAAIKVINQPIESFGGRPREDDRAFQMRVAERLRHKDRAILPWDYEQLVLERFPTIWKVQALPAMNAQGDSAPGRVLVVIVTGPGGIQVADPTEPLATSEMLEQVRLYLASLASPFAGIQVVNPVYVRVKVFAEVMFQDGKNGSEDSGAGVDRLNSELIQYLSPWFYDAERALRRGDYASEDAISQFIQTRPYVQALIRLRLEHDPPPETLGWYFLTSAKDHSITDADGTSGATDYKGEQP